MGIAFSCLGANTHQRNHPAGQGVPHSRNAWFGRGQVPQGFMDCTHIARQLAPGMEPNHHFAVKPFTSTHNEFADAMEVLSRHWDGQTPLFGQLADGRARIVVKSVVTLLKLGALPENNLTRHAARTQSLPVPVAHALAAKGRDSADAEISLLDRFKLLHHAGFDPRQRDSNGLNAADYAALFNNAPALTALEHMGVDLQEADAHGTTPLHRAAATGSVAALELLLAPASRLHHLAHATPSFLGGHQGPLHEASANALDHEARAPLHWAMMHPGGEKSLPILLAHGADIETPDRHGTRPAEIAAAQGTPRHLRKLQALGLLPAYDALRHDNLFDLMHDAAVRAKRHENVIALIALAKDVTFTHRVVESAAERGDSGLLNDLRDAGLCLDAPNRGGVPQLPHLVYYGEGKGVLSLLQAGANVESTGPGRHTPMHVAAAQGKVRLIRTLMDWQANIDARDGHDRTALHVAAALDQPESVEALIEEGADPTARDDQGRTPLDIAASDRVVRALGGNPEHIAHARQIDHRLRREIDAAA